MHSFNARSTKGSGERRKADAPRSAEAQQDRAAGEQWQSLATNVPEPGGEPTPRHERYFLTSTPLQTKLVVGRTGDRYEQEADRVADQVVQRLEAPAPPRAEAQGATPVAGEPRVQRQAEGEGEESEGQEGDYGVIEGLLSVTPVEDAVVQTKLVVGAPDDELEREANASAVAAVPSTAPPDKEEEEVLQAKSADGKATALLASGRSDLDTRLLASQAGGSPLAAPLRASMERAFGADFGDVRVHRDGSASQMAADLHAHAFTTGRDIYFGTSTFRPETTEGKRLLAHELTHVLQQRGARSGPQRVQRNPKAGAKAAADVLVGKLVLFDDKDEVLMVIGVFRQPSASLQGIGPGMYEATLSQGDGGYVVTVQGKAFSFTPSTAGAKKAFSDLSKIKRALLSVVREKSKGGADQSEYIRTDKDAKGAAGEPRAGSAFGWLGLLDLPQELIDVLESVFKAFGDSEEYLALKDTITTLNSLSENQAQLTALFKDSDALLNAALGIDENAALEKLASWAESEPKEPKETKDTKHKGIIALAKKIVKLVRKVRAILQPVFKTRAAFKQVFEFVVTALVQVPAMQDLFDAGADLTEVASKGFEKRLEDASTQLGKTLQEKIDAARKLLTAVKETFTDADFVTYEELASAMTAAALKAVPKPYQLAVKAAQAIGLDDLISKNLVAPLIPKATLDGLNGAIRSLAKQLEPTIDAAQKDVDQVVGDIGTGLKESLPKDLKSFFLAQTDAEPGALPPGPATLGAAERAIRSSTGAPLDQGVRRDMEGRLGGNFDDVRIHRGAGAAQANELLSSRALTVGRDIYFGAGEYSVSSTEGQRRLAHELTHVMQQRALPEVGLVQGDWKAVRKKLVAKFGTKVKDALKVTSGTPEMNKRGAEMRNEVEKLIGKTVSSKTNPKLPEAYDYIESGGSIVAIRRKLKWIRQVPGLTLEKPPAGASHMGTIRLGILAKLASFDPNNRARAELRKNMGCKKNEQAHHVVPLELKDHPVAKLAVANGWNFNGGKNGVCLDTSVHSGSHPVYTAKVRAKLDALAKAHTDWAEMKGPFETYVSGQRTRLKNKTDKLE